MVNSNIFRHTHILSDILSHIVAYSEPCVTLAYSEHCRIQSSGIFRTQNRFRNLSRHICHIQNAVKRSHIEKPAIFRILAFRTPGILQILFKYVHSSVFRHIQ